MLHHHHLFVFHQLRDVVGFVTLWSLSDLEVQIFALKDSQTTQLQPTTFGKDTVPSTPSLPRCPLSEAPTTFDTPIVRTNWPSPQPTPQPKQARTTATRCIAAPTTRTSTPRPPLPSQPLAPVEANTTETSPAQHEIMGFLPVNSTRKPAGTGRTKKSADKVDPHGLGAGMTDFGMEWEAFLEVIADILEKEPAFLFVDSVEWHWVKPANSVLVLVFLFSLHYNDKEVQGSPKKIAPLKLDFVLCINVYPALKDEEMIKRCSSSANSLEASVRECLDEPRILLLGLAHILTCVAFTEVSWARHPAGDGIDVRRIGGWHGARPVDEFDERGPEPRKVVTVIALKLDASRLVRLEFGPTSSREDLSRLWNRLLSPSDKYMVLKHVIKCPLPLPIKLFRSPPSTVEDSSPNGRNRSWIRRKIRVFIWARLIRWAWSDSSIATNNPIYANTLFISRTLLKLVAPPCAALSIKKHLCKIEGFSGATNSTFFESISSQTAVTDSFRMVLKEPFGPGISEDDPMVLVIEAEDAEKRSASTAQSMGLPEAVTPEPRYVYYRLYEEEGAMTSKTSFDSDDSSLGRVDTLSIAPPQTVSSLRSQIVKAEGITGRKIQLFGDMDGEVPMNDNDHISFQAQVFPGHIEDEPITLVCSQEKAERKQKNVRGQAVRDPTFNKPLKGPVAWNPDPRVQSDWLPFEANEIMYTDGVKTTGYIAGSTDPYSGYMAVNSAGRKGFVYEYRRSATFCNRADRGAITSMIGSVAAAMHYSGYQCYQALVDSVLIY
ncbi:uncharacterized protein LACBIDRAFT_329325 [Laccaria bicolor S238N-H82]|uniref:Predicted protein n=1 Tax=Laccaria bicolor (strain S238N-H82 / ATCC MYA-4686) TaxID=486041 RepID=B0DHP1_LACBS|nr:uncharacterized protein LACBIDRAFT_329325 [Laccaria bicolor S238N-H82]EDR05869.1 predicted protein [Laccaria bicolor S238N-H82]|eukprot:XP_001883545.1 predicted protein [Laccaria bicolor S238N-H82]